MAHGWEKLDLLRRVVGDRGVAAERVEMKLEEALLGEPVVALSILLERAARERELRNRRLRAVDVAGDELQARVAKARSRAVQDAHPRADVEKAVVRVRAGAERQVVVGPPGDAGRLVRDARVVAARLLGR